MLQNTNNGARSRPVSAVVVPNSSNSLHASVSFLQNEFEYKDVKATKSHVPSRPKSQKFSRFMDNKRMQKYKAPSSPANQSTNNSIVDYGNEDPSISAFSDCNDDEPTVSITTPSDSIDSYDNSATIDKNKRQGLSLYERKTSLVKKFEERKKYRKYISPELFIFDKKLDLVGDFLPKERKQQDEFNSICNKDSAHEEYMDIKIETEGMEDDQRDENKSRASDNILRECNIETFRWESPATVMEQQRLRDVIKRRLGSGFVQSRTLRDKGLDDKTKEVFFVDTASTVSSSQDGTIIDSNKHDDLAVNRDLSSNILEDLEKIEITHKKDRYDSVYEETRDNDSADDAVTIVLEEILGVNELPDRKYNEFVVSWVDEKDKEMNKTNGRNGPVTKIIEHHQSNVDPPSSNVDPPCSGMSIPSYVINIRDPPTESMEESINNLQTKDDLSYVAERIEHSTYERHHKDIYQHSTHQTHHIDNLTHLVIQPTVSTIDHYGIEDKYEVYEQY